MFFSNDSQSAFKTDITDEGDAYRLEADLPGFDKKDIHVDINGDRMTVSAQRHSDYEEKDKKASTFALSVPMVLTAAASM